jgi:Na+-driven multidrug efflux pump
MVWLIENVVTLVDKFAVAAGTDPLAAVAFAFGALFITLSAGAFGALALASLLSPLAPDIASSPKQP